MSQEGNKHTPLISGVITFCVLTVSLYWLIPYVLGGMTREEIVIFAGIGTDMSLTALLFACGVLLSFTISAAVYLYFFAHMRADILVESKTSELIKSRDFFLQLFDNSPVPYLMVDKDAVIVLPNKAAQRLFLREAQDLMTYKFHNLFDDAYIVESRQIYEKFIRGVATTNVELEVVQKNKKKRWVRLSALPFRTVGRGSSGGVVAMVDITEQKAIDKVKTEFVSLASHQLRTPLSAMKWYGEMLLSKDHGTLNEKQQKYLEKIYSGNERMIELVNLLLSASRFELGNLTIDIKHVDPVIMAGELLDDLHVDIQKKNLHVIENYQGDNTNVFTDEKLLRMIMQNLISNAVKYNTDNGQLIIGIVCTNDNITLTVADTGLGIPEEDKEKMFTKMFRAKNARSQVTDGSGLGLYIVKEAAEALGGTIGFTSEENKGAVFTVILPNGTHGNVPVNEGFQTDTTKV